MFAVGSNLGNLGCICKDYFSSMGDQQSFKPVQIRWANESDVSDLTCLENECFDTYYRGHRFDKTQFISYLDRKRAIFFVAVSDSSLIGYVAGSVRASRSESWARLDSIAVLPQSRRKGVGDRLMQRFISEVTRRASKTIILEVAAANENGILFFSKHGFERTRRLPAYYGKGFDGILMKLDI